MDERMKQWSLEMTIQLCISDRFTTTMPSCSPCKIVMECKNSRYARMLTWMQTNAENNWTRLSSNPTKRDNSLILQIRYAHITAMLLYKFQLIWRCWHECRPMLKLIQLDCQPTQTSVITTSYCTCTIHTSTLCCYTSFIKFEDADVNADQCWN